MFNGIAVGRPPIVVGFEMETKVGAKTSRDGSAEIGGGGDVSLFSLEESIELLLAVPLVMVRTWSQWRRQRNA
jgi:hypothetical protein